MIKKLPVVANENGSGAQVQNTSQGSQTEVSVKLLSTKNENLMLAKSLIKKEIIKGSHIKNASLSQRAWMLVEQMSLMSWHCSNQLSSMTRLRLRGNQRVALCVLQ